MGALSATGGGKRVPFVPVLPGSGTAELSRKVFGSGATAGGFFPEAVTVLILTAIARRFCGR